MLILIYTMSQKTRTPNIKMT